MLTAEQVWYERLHRAQRAQVDKAAARELWHEVLVVHAGRDPGTFRFELMNDPERQGRELARVLSKLGDYYGIGPFPAERVAV